MRITAILAALAMTIGSALAGQAAASDYRVEYAFQGGHGKVPLSGLIPVGQKLYGTAYEGGGGPCSGGCGVIFSLAP